MKQASLLFAILATLVAFGGCCDKETKRIQPHWLRAYEGYELNLIEIARGDTAVSFSPILDQRGNCFKDRSLDACIARRRYGFWLDVTNQGERPVRLLWPEARYVDEDGGDHGVYHYSRTADPPANVLAPDQSPTVVARGESKKEIIAPGYKTYNVASGCRELAVFREPLVPTKLEGMSEQQMKAYVDELARKQVPVRLVLPVEIGGQRHDYMFSFVLKDRWADLPEE